MTKPIAFQCPRGKKPHDAYYHGNAFAGCPIHGRLLYTDIPQELRNKKGFKSQLTRILEKGTKENEKIKKEIGKLIQKSIADSFLHGTSDSNKKPVGFLEKRKCE